MLPKVLANDIPADDGTGRISTWFHGPPDGSWACVDSDPNQSDYQVCQHRPRLLWDDIESILTWWQQASRPPQLTSGLTGTPHGQRLRLGCPDGLTWSARQMP